MAKDFREFLKEVNRSYHWGRFFDDIIISGSNHLLDRPGKFHTCMLVVSPFVHLRSRFNRFMKDLLNWHKVLWQNNS